MLVHWHQASVSGTVLVPGLCNTFFGGFFRNWCNLLGFGQVLASVQFSSVQFSSVQDGIYDAREGPYMRFTPSLRSFPNVAPRNSSNVGVIDAEERQLRQSRATPG